MSDLPPKNGDFADGKLWFHRKLTTVTLGMTTLAIEEIGTVQSVELPDEGDDFTKGDVIVTVDGSMGRIEVVTPVSGVIAEINESLKEDPEIVSDDPLEEGWLIKLEAEDTSELKELI